MNERQFLFATFVEILNNENEVKLLGRRVTVMRIFKGQKIHLFKVNKVGKLQSRN